MKTRASEDITPVTEFRSRSAELLSRIRKNRRPLILTHRGRSAAIIEDVRDYEDRLDRLELLESIVRGMQAAEQRQMVPHRELLRRVDELLDD